MASTRIVLRNSSQYRGLPGTPGTAGADGVGIRVLGTKATTGALPSSGNTIDDAWVVTADQKLYVWGANSAWNGPLTFTGGLPDPSAQADGKVLETSSGAAVWATFAGGVDTSTIHAATSKTTPVDTDEMLLVDSAASFGLKKLTWANLKAAIKSYLDGTGIAKLTTARNINGVAFDGTGNIEVVAAGTHAASSKTTPVDADAIPLIDSAASNGLKQLTIANLRAFILAAVDDALDLKQDSATLLDDVLTVIPGVMLARDYDNVADAWPTVDTALLTDSRVTLVWEESDESTPPPTSAGTTGKPAWVRKTS